MKELEIDGRHVKKKINIINSIILFGVEYEDDLEEYKANNYYDD